MRPPISRVPIRKGLEAVAENSQLINPQSDPVAWNTNVALNATLTALGDLQSRLDGIERQLRQMQ